MQNANVVNRMSNGNYRPTPEPPKSTVRGRVFYEDTGRAVKRTSIMLMGKGGGRELSGLTDNNGVFEIKDVVAGTYYAFVNAPGVVSPLAYADISKQKEGMDEAVEGFPPIIVNGIGDLDVQIPARRGGAISGRIMYADGDAAIGVKVEILRKVKEKFITVIPNFSSIISMMMGGGGGGFQTDDRGVYRFAGLPNGEYIVKVTENVSHGENKPSGYGGFEWLMGGSSLLTMFYPDVLTTEKAQIVNVVAGQEQSEINIYIPSRDLYTVQGKVINAKDKTPVKNATVFLKRTGENIFSIFDEVGRSQQSDVSDEQGIWNFKEIPKGTYTLSIKPSNYNDEYASNRMSSNSNRMPNNPPKPKLAKKTQEITIDNQNLSEIVVELGYGATVSGTVKTESNQAMPTIVTIIAVQDNPEINSSTTVYNSPPENSAYAGNSSVVMATNSPAGNSPRTPNYDFKIEGAAGGKTFLAASTGDADFYVKSAIFNGVDLLTNPIDLKEGDVLRNVQFIISKGSGTLKGTVSDDEKQPAKKMETALVPVEAAKRKNPNFNRSATTGETGEFEIKAAPGEYAVVIYTKEFYSKKGEELDRWLDEAVKNAPKVTLKSGETEKISLVVPK